KIAVDPRSRVKQGRENPEKTRSDGRLAAGGELEFLSVKKVSPCTNIQIPSPIHHPVRPKSRSRSCTHIQIHPPIHPFMQHSPESQYAPEISSCCLHYPSPP